MTNKRYYVRKKEEFNVQEKAMLNEIKNTLMIDTIKTAEIYNIYDLYNIDEADVTEVKVKVISESFTDDVFEAIDLENKIYFAMEALPNQFDQRADSAMQCIKLINPKSKCTVRSGSLFIFDGITNDDLQEIKKYYINEIESYEKDLTVQELKENKRDLTEETIEDFLSLSESKLLELYKYEGFSFAFEDFKFIQNHYQKENKNPILGELKIIDTYWSDHCRHTTFNTHLENIEIKDNEINQTFTEYKKIKEKVAANKPITFMDLATVYSKYAQKTGIKTNVEKTIEDNAISIEIEDEGKTHLLQFKNETHNHPTEIEPFGGASTCIGGAIRDPLSGRAYVYQGMRISGAANINEKTSDTLPGKLPQNVISKKSALGFSSYGNQIGLATTFVKELYHPGYKAKHLEAGAVIGVANKDVVVRSAPQKGDIVLLIGAKTGFDGIGGATGSSKSHTEKSLEDCAVEVQKGNAPIERKIQRLFRHDEVIKLIKKSNDFGAGGVSVAIGELSDSIEIQLDKVPLKVQNVKVSEIALSESQERMSVVIDKNDYEEFKKYADMENVDVTKVATITDNNRLVMKYHDEVIIDMDKNFLNTGGVSKKQNAVVGEQNREFKSKITTLEDALKDLNIADNKTQETMFDSTVGATTVAMPYGGKYQLTKNQCSIQKIPTSKRLVSCASFGYNPYVMEANPYKGAIAAVVDSVTKLIVSGVKLKDTNLSFQEYFQKLGESEENYGIVLSALLGAFHIQKELEICALGGKDSMSGTYNDINVAPTLISFAFGHTDIDKVITSEIKSSEEKIYILDSFDEEFSIAKYKENLKIYEQLNKANKITTGYAVQEGGVAVALYKMLKGNKLGANVQTNLDLYEAKYGTIIFTSKEELDYPKLGDVVDNPALVVNEQQYDMEELLTIEQSTFARVYPALKETKVDEQKISSNSVVRKYAPETKNNPKVFIPIFSGTNSEFEMQRAFEDVGFTADAWVFKDLTDKDVENSITTMESKIKEADVIAISGGFSGADEPDGSGKYIVNILANPKIKKAVEEHLAKDKLILGICNGFQALMKSGLITHGEINLNNEATLFKNDCNQHLSQIVQTKCQTNNSPWLTTINKDVHYSQVISHGEGKVVASQSQLKKFIENDQIAFTYALSNPNGSYLNIEGLVSPCGKVLGKMAHSERYVEGLYKNISGNKKIDIFQNAMDYFKGEENE